MCFTDKGHFCCDYVSIKMYKSNIKQILHILEIIQLHIRKVALVIKTMRATQEVMGKITTLIWIDIFFSFILLKVHKGAKHFFLESDDGSISDTSGYILNDLLGVPVLL